MAITQFKLDMKLAVNYSLPTVNLLRKKQIEIDYLKCPAWPDLVDEAQRIHPVYVHFPLSVGRGIRDVVDTETGQRPDWNAESGSTICL